MEDKQGNKSQSDVQMNRPPLVAVETPEEQVDIAAVDFPSLIARHKDKLD
jgi:hypothetical protein